MCSNTMRHPARAQELVQVESLAQIGVQLLLFTLGLEFRCVYRMLASSICTLHRRWPRDCPPNALPMVQRTQSPLDHMVPPRCSLSKLRAVRGVALLGGVLQVLLTMVLAGGVASAIGASIHEGVFIGALVRPSKP